MFREEHLSHPPHTDALEDVIAVGYDGADEIVGRTLEDERRPVDRAKARFGAVGGAALGADLTKAHARDGPMAGAGQRGAPGWESKLRPVRGRSRRQCTPLASISRLTDRHRAVRLSPASAVHNDR